MTINHLIDNFLRILNVGLRQLHCHGLMNHVLGKTDVSLSLDESGIPRPLHLVFGQFREIFSMGRAVNPRIDWVPVLLAFICKVKSTFVFVSGSERLCDSQKTQLVAFIFVLLRQIMDQMRTSRLAGSRCEEWSHNHEGKLVAGVDERP